MHLKICLSLFIVLLFTKNGFTQNIELVKDLDPQGHGYPQLFHVYKDYLYFNTFIEGEGYSLWRTDGSTEGTEIFITGELSILPIAFGFKNFKDKMYFIFSDRIHGNELWSSNGTREGTSLVKDIIPGASGSFERNIFHPNHPNTFFKVGSKLIFFAKDEHSDFMNLWETDGTQLGTKMVKKLNFNPQYHYINESNDKIYFNTFSYESQKANTQIYSSDGTANGTQIIKEFENKNILYIANMFSSYKDHTYFFISNDYPREKLGSTFWKTDGTAKNTKKVKENLYPKVSEKIPLTTYKDKLFLIAEDNQNNYGLWVSDGTTNGTKLIKPISNNKIYNNIVFKKYNDLLYFFITDKLNRFGLWVTNGTPQGTQLIHTLEGIYNPQPKALTHYGNKLYFIANSDEYGAQLYETDGTAENTKIVTLKNEYNYDALSNIEEIAVFNGALYFNANYDDKGYELYKLTTASGLLGDHLPNTSWQIYPNPSNDYIQFKDQEKPMSIQIIDINGRVINDLSINKNTQIDVRHLNSGIYLIRDIHSKEVRKFVKQ